MWQVFTTQKLSGMYALTKGNLPPLCVQIGFLIRKFSKKKRLRGKNKLEVAKNYYFHFDVPKKLR